MTGRAATIQAIKEGVLVRQPCRDCGVEAVEAHHLDYDKPLEVVWLCRSCHAKEHVRMKNAGEMLLNNQESEVVRIRFGGVYYSLLKDRAKQEKRSIVNLCRKLIEDGMEASNG